MTDNSSDTILVVVATPHMAQDCNQKSLSKNVRYISPGQAVMGLRCGTLISLIAPWEFPGEERQKVMEWLSHLRCRLVPEGQLVSV